MQVAYQVVVMVINLEAMSNARAGEGVGDESCVASHFFGRFSIGVNLRVAKIAAIRIE